MKDLYDKNFKTFNKETEEGIRILDDFLCSWLCKISIVKMAMLLNLQIQWNFPQNSNTIFHRCGRDNFQLHMETQKNKDT